MADNIEERSCILCGAAIDKGSVCDDCLQGAMDSDPGELGEGPDPDRAYDEERDRQMLSGSTWGHEGEELEGEPR